MATVKTHDLIKCNRVNDVLPSVNNAGLIPYNGLFVKFDNQDNKSYKVRKNVQGRFLDGIEATEVYDVQWSIISMKFNGVEFISAPAGLQVLFLQQDLSFKFKQPFLIILLETNMITLAMLLMVLLFLIH